MAVEASAWWSQVFVAQDCLCHGHVRKASPRGSLRTRNRRLTVPTTVALETCRKWCFPTLACPFAKQPAVRRTRHRMLYAATVILLQLLLCTLSFSSFYTSSPLVLPILPIHTLWICVSNILELQNISATEKHTNHTSARQNIIYKRLHPLLSATTRPFQRQDAFCL